MKVREVGVIAAAARLVSVMKRKLNRRAALIQGKLPRRKLTVTNRQKNTNCIVLTDLMEERGITKKLAFGEKNLG